MPRIVKWAYTDLVWQMPPKDGSIHLTFDDGPTPGVTLPVLDMLDAVEAKATFFLIGKNAAAHPELMQEIIRRGHAVGNHTYNHENGWQTPIENYLSSVENTSKILESNLFRPPYGRITRQQIKALSQDYTIVMWDVLSGDYDKSITPEESIDNVLRNVRPGSIIVFHDSVKAWPNVQKSLPIILQELHKRELKMRTL